MVVLVEVRGVEPRSLWYQEWLSTYLYCC